SQPIEVCANVGRRKRNGQSSGERLRGFPRISGSQPGVGFVNVRPALERRAIVPLRELSLALPPFGRTGEVSRAELDAYTRRQDFGLEAAVAQFECERLCVRVRRLGLSPGRALGETEGVNVPDVSRCGQSFSFCNLDRAPGVPLALARHADEVRQY